MEVIRTTGGDINFISNRDLVDAIRDQMGDEFANHIEEIINDVDYETKLAREKATTDEIAVMEENEGLRTAMLDALEIVEELQGEQAGRVNKKRLLARLDDISRVLNEGL